MPQPEYAPFLRQLKGLALPLVEALVIGPVDVDAGDAVEGGDGVTSTPAGRGTLTVHDRDPCV
jgi:hypothetical protein